MRKILLLTIIALSSFTALSVEQPYTKIADLIMKYGNAPYGENVFLKLGIPLTQDLGDNNSSYAFEGVDMNGKVLTVKLQRVDGSKDLDYIGFIVDSCYIDNIIQSLLDNGYIIHKDERKDNYGYGTIAHQKIFKSDRVMCIVQTGNNYLKGKLYLYYTYRFSNNNLINSSASDMVVVDLNAIFDPDNKYDTDWNSTEIPPDWLEDTGVYFDNQRGKFYELKTFYDLRQSNLSPISGILINPANVKQPAVYNTLEPLRRINAAKSGILEYVNAVEYIEPIFPGGNEALFKYIRDNFNLNSKSNIERGKVEATFDIDESGNVVNVKITRGLSEEIDREFLRVIKSLPKFKPGTANGKPYKFEGYRIPLNFKSQN